MITPPKKNTSRAKKKNSGRSRGGGRLMPYWVDGKSEENGDEPAFYLSDGDGGCDEDAEWKPKSKKGKDRKK